MEQGTADIGRDRIRKETALGVASASLEGAILGLLALMLGFTFAMAMSRYEDRRVTILNEANAIGTAALRARLLPAPFDAEMLKDLHQYVHIQVDLLGHDATRAEIKSAVDQANALQESIWSQLKAVAAVNNNMVPTGILAQSLNDMIHHQETRLAAISNVVPDLVLAALFSIADVAIMFAGYASGAGIAGVAAAGLPLKHDRVRRHAFDHRSRPARRRLYPRRRAADERRRREHRAVQRMNEAVLPATE